MCGHCRVWREPEECVELDLYTVVSHPSWLLGIGLRHQALLTNEPSLNPQVLNLYLMKNIKSSDNYLALVNTMNVDEFYY